MSQTRTLRGAVPRSSYVERANSEESEDDQGSVYNEDSVHEQDSSTESGSEYVDSEDNSDDNDSEDSDTDESDEDGPPLTRIKSKKERDELRQAERQVLHTLGIELTDEQFTELRKSMRLTYNVASRSNQKHAHSMHFMMRYAYINLLPHDYLSDDDKKQSGPKVVVSWQTCGISTLPNSASLRTSHGGAASARA